MTDPLPPDDLPPSTPEAASPDAEDASSPPPEPDPQTTEMNPFEVALVVPASDYKSIDTLDSHTTTGQPPVAPLPLLPEAEAVGIPPGPGPGPVPGPDPTAPVLEALGSLGADLGRRLDALSTQFDRELRAEASREKVVDRLHAELQEYKNDLLLKALRPVFLDLIQLHDDMGKMADALDDPRAADLLRDFQLGIEDILYRQGVEPYTTEDDRFDPRRQRAVSTVPTDDPDSNKTVAARLRKGFVSGEKIIRPELVSVYAAKKP